MVWPEVLIDVRNFGIYYLGNAVMVDNRALITAVLVFVRLAVGQADFRSKLSDCYTEFKIIYRSYKKELKLLLEIGVSPFKS